MDASINDSTKTTVQPLKIRKAHHHPRPLG